MNTLIYFLVDGEWKNISAIFLQVIFSNWKIMELLSILSRMCIYCGDMRFDQNKNVVLMRMMEVKSRRKSHLLIWSIASMIVLIHLLLQSLRILQGSLILFCLYVVQAPHSLTTTKRWWNKMCTDCFNSTNSVMRPYLHLMPWPVFLTTFNFCLWKWWETITWQRSCTQRHTTEH